MTDINDYLDVDRSIGGGLQNGMDGLTQNGLTQNGMDGLTQNGLTQNGMDGSTPRVMLPTPKYRPSSCLSTLRVMLPTPKYRPSSTPATSRRTRGRSRSCASASAMASASAAARASARLPDPKFKCGQSVLFAQVWRQLKFAQETPKTYSRWNYPVWFSADILSFKEYGTIRYAGQEVKDNLYNVYVCDGTYEVVLERFLREKPR